MFKFAITTATLIFNAGAILLLFFILLGGAFDRFPLNRFFWLEADTSQISGAPKKSRWTLYGFCEVKDGVNSNCSSNRPAYAIQPEKNFGTTKGVPQDFIDNHDTYFYLSRFAFPFFLIGIFFAVLSLIMGTLAYVSRLGAAITSSITFLAFIFVAAASAVETACYVMARDAFNDQKSGSAHLGVKLMAFAWTTTACLLFSLIGFCMGWHRSSKAAAAAGGGAFAARSSSFEKSKPSSGKQGFFSSIRKKRGNNYDDDAFVRGGETSSQQPVMNPVSSYERA